MLLTIEDVVVVFFLLINDQYLIHAEDRLAQSTIGVNDRFTKSIRHFLLHSNNNNNDYQGKTINSNSDPNHGQKMITITITNVSSTIELLLQWMNMNECIHSTNSINTTTNSTTIPPVNWFAFSHRFAIQCLLVFIILLLVLLMCFYPGNYVLFFLLSFGEMKNLKYFQSLSNNQYVN